MFTSVHARKFRIFLIGQLISNIGGWTQRVSQDWLVLPLTGTGRQPRRRADAVPQRFLVIDLRRRRRLQRLPDPAVQTELATLAAATGLRITVSHLPPGTSKWNKMEYRLFSPISMNWRGRPLTSHEVIVQTIAATTPAPD